MQVSISGQLGNGWVGGLPWSIWSGQAALSQVTRKRKRLLMDDLGKSIWQRDQHVKYERHNGNSNLGTSACPSHRQNQTKPNHPNFWPRAP